jgi:hypothetical protein
MGMKEIFAFTGQLIKDEKGTVCGTASGRSGFSCLSGQECKSQFWKTLILELTSCVDVN